MLLRVALIACNRSQTLLSEKSAQMTSFSSCWIEMSVKSGRYTSTMCQYWSQSTREYVKHALPNSRCLSSWLLLQSLVTLADSADDLSWSSWRCLMLPTIWDDIQKGEMDEDEIDAQNKWIHVTRSRLYIEVVKSEKEAKIRNGILGFSWSFLLLLDSSRMLYLLQVEYFLKGAWANNIL